VDGSYELPEIPTLKLALLCPDAQIMVDHVQKHMYENVYENARSEFDFLRRAERSKDKRHGGAQSIAGSSGPGTVFTSSFQLHRKKKQRIKLSSWRRHEPTKVREIEDLVAKNENEETTISDTLTFPNFLKLYTMYLSSQRERLPADANAFSVANVLFAAGADIHVRDNQGNGVLHWVVQDLEFDVTYPAFSCTLFSSSVSSQEKSKRIRELVHLGAQINEANAVGHTALHEACVRGELEVCTTLLKLGANPNLLDRNGRLPIQLLLSSDHVNLSSVKELLKYGTGVPIERSDIASNLEDVTCKITRRARTIARVERIIDATYKDAISPPCIRQRGATVRDMLAHVDNFKYSAIHFVCGALALDSRNDFSSSLNSRLEVFRYLLELRNKHGLKNHVENAENGRSPLHCLTIWIKNRNHENAIGFADELLRLGAKSDSIDRELMPARLTPLHYSLIYDNAELANHFVKNTEIEWNKIGDTIPSAFLIACGQTSTSIELLQSLLQGDDNLIKSHGPEGLSSVEITKRFAGSTLFL